MKRTVVGGAILGVVIAAVAYLALMPSQPVHSPDFKIWGELLRRHVDARGMVDYAAWKAKDIPELDRFLTQQGAEDPRAFHDDRERLAFWINAYNACCIRLVLKHYPVKRVVDIPSFFDLEEFKIGGEQLSLNKLEHGRIRKRFKEPRVHFALVCAAKSCPRLLNEPYEAETLEHVLDGRAREFLADPTRNRYDLAGVRAELSEIFKMYTGDFSQHSGDLVTYVRKYAPAHTQVLLTRPDLKLSFLVYDLTLNGLQ